MKLNIDEADTKPVFQQIVDQIYFAIRAGEMLHGDKLPSIRAIAGDNDVSANTVAKALRQLEFRGLIAAKDRSGFMVTGSESVNRYQARGVSASKSEVHSAVDRLDPGQFPNAFCKITEDYLGGNPDYCNIIHADGSGTKSIIAYLHYKETGDASVFQGIAQDSIVMNLDDLLCVGVTGRVVLSNTINRNAMNCPGEVVSALIEGTEQFLAELRQWGVNIVNGGGETADVGDLTGTVVVDSCAVTIMKKRDVITGNEIKPGLAIVGLASNGKAAYENTENSGIGSNGLTSARHELLSQYYALTYPESFDANIDESLVYCGPYKLDDPLPDSSLSVGEALLSPTRTYAPVVYKLINDMPGELKGLVHCSGGAQTKCLKFGHRIHYVKDSLFEIPPVFAAIEHVSGTSWKEMYQVFNMGHRMEVYCKPPMVDEIVSVAESFGVTARQIGYTEASDQGNKLSLKHGTQTFEY